jgi:hypothetical protein
MPVAKVPPKPEGNWARISKIWLPIDTLTANQPAVLANEDQTITWFLAQPTPDTVLHSYHLAEADGTLIFGDGGKPAYKEVEVEPKWWTPAVYVDKHGEPIF